MIYVVPDYPDDLRNVLRCSDHPDFSVSFPGRSLEIELAGMPGNATPVGWLISEANDHLQRDHIALPVNVS